MAKKNPALTSSYSAPKSPVKIPKGDTGFKIVKKSFDKAFEDDSEDQEQEATNEEKRGETQFYAPPQSPIAIQPGDTGFKTVGKSYNRFIWTFNDWHKSKKKIIDPDKNWGLSEKPITQSEWEKKKKGLYL